MNCLLRALVSAVGVAALAPSLPGTVLAAGARPGEEKAVVARLQALLDGLAKRDKAAIAAQLLPGGTATLMREGKPVQMTFDAFADRLSAPGADTREERIHDPLVRIDNNIAVIWARFDLIVNGKLDRCGTDLINLVKVEGRWLISSVGDTSRTGCK